MNTAERQRPATGRIVSLARRALMLELLMYASIGRAVIRRPAVPSGARGFRYDSPVLVLLVVFAVVSGVEVVALDLILRPWPMIRIPFLVLGIWGFFWTVGLVCAHVMRPHTIGPDGLRVRDGMDLDCAVDRADVDSVRLAQHRYGSKPPRIVEDDGARRLVVAVSYGTNVEVALVAPTSVLLPGSPPRGGRQVVDRIDLWVDDPRGFLAEAGRHLR